MTSTQRECVIRLRREGRGYTEIANAAGLPKDTVSSFCRRNGLGGQQKSGSREKRCPQCGKEMKESGRTKPKRFCSDECRRLWWNAHPEWVKRKAEYEFVCAGCGKRFGAYGNSGRKYCSHSCYVQSRFKGGGSR